MFSQSLVPSLTLMFFHTPHYFRAVSHPNTPLPRRDHPGGAPARSQRVFGVSIEASAKLASDVADRASSIDATERSLHKEVRPICVENIYVHLCM
jgi:hypothetical protein